MFGIFLITYFGIYLVYNLEHFGIFYSANLATLIEKRVELAYVTKRFITDHINELNICLRVTAFNKRAGSEVKHL